MADRYPQPGTWADRVLEFILQNPETTRTSIKKALNVNASVLRDCLRGLESKGLVTDTKDAQNWHHYTAKGPKL